MRKIGIDSFTIWVQLDIFTYFNQNLTSKVIEVYESTGEIRDEHDRKPIFKIDNGVKYKARILLPFGNRPVLELTINSRMLKENYYVRGTIQTIHDDNFRTIFADVCTTIGLECDYYDFLDCSTIYDVDICFDFISNQVDFERICSSVNSSPFGSSFYITLDGDYMAKSKKITGSQLKTRETSSIKKPFVKYYTKYWEFIHKSHEFYGTYASEFIDENYRRCEGQIKNARHFLWLEKRGCLPQGFCEGGVSLRGLLLLSDDYLEKCLEELILQYALPLKKGGNGRSGINASDFILMKTISFLMAEGFTLEHCIDFLDDYSDNFNTVATAKSRLRKRMKRAFSSHFGLENLIVTDDDLVRLSSQNVLIS